MESERKREGIRLVVAEDRPFIRPLLTAGDQPEEGYVVITTARTGEGALEIARELAPDCLVIDASLPDTARVLRVAERQPICALVVVRSPSASSAAGKQGSLVELARQGAIVYSSPAPASQDLIYAIEAACGCFKRERALRERIQQLEERMETLRLTDRAKSLLMQQGLTEEEAFSLLQKTAMNTRRPLRAVAEAIILTPPRPYGRPLPGPSPAARPRTTLPGRGLQSLVAPLVRADPHRILNVLDEHLPIPEGCVSHIGNRLVDDRIDELVAHHRAHRHLRQHINPPVVIPGVHLAKPLLVPVPEALSHEDSTFGVSQQYPLDSLQLIAVHDELYLLHGQILSILAFDRTPSDATRRV